MRSKTISLICRMIYRIAKYQIQSITENDILFVLRIMNRSEESITTTSLQTIKTIIKRFTDEAESIVECFPVIISNLIIKQLKLHYFDDYIITRISQIIFLILNLFTQKDELIDSAISQITTSIPKISMDQFKANLINAKTIDDVKSLIISMIIDHDGYLKEEIQQKLEFQEIRRSLE